MFCICCKLYDLIYTIYCFTDEEIIKINRRCNKDDIFMDYI